MSDEALCCSLTGPRRAQRIKEWAALTAHATSQRQGPNRIISTYPAEKEIVEELRRLIAAEAECCSFMKFDVHETPSLVRVELTVPEEMTGFLDTMVGLTSPKLA